MEVKAVAAGRAGFVLVGGRSSRMGEDKALLRAGGTMLVERVAQAVAEAAGNVALIGDPEKYGYLGYAVLPDTFPGCGPLGGIHAALSAARAEWNLVLACDMPEVRADFLRVLLESAEREGADALLPRGPSGMAEPLCAVYHRRALAAIESALGRGTRKVTDGLAGLRTATFEVGEPRVFRNLNTQNEWLDYTGAQKSKTKDPGI